ncbi:protein SLC31A2-like isoform X2 [Ruditapes philippinarum]|uniref:protein SLC31A2-like isoform X2 n=1 Tax=Ruditapes philippinarum TaxID=129788 RepID=UPI00295B9BB4|nr:protein SLC31A2-like isoform X2 [Ruditapes philippinarum]
MAFYFQSSGIIGSDGFLLPTLEMMKNMSMHMGEYFYFSNTVKNFIFEDLHFHGSAGVVCVCLIIFAFTVMLEGTKSLIFYLNLRKTQNPLTYGRTDTSIQSERIKFHVGSYLLHMVDLMLAYLLMLAVMSYDAYILIAVIFGSGVGYFIFGAVNAKNKLKFHALKMGMYDLYDSQTGLTNSQTGLTNSQTGLRNSQTGLTNQSQCSISSSTTSSKYGSNGVSCANGSR